jgi:hypothetical protein
VFRAFSFIECLDRVIDLRNPYILNSTHSHRYEMRE